MVCVEPSNTPANTVAPLTALLYFLLPLFPLLQPPNIANFHPDANTCRKHFTVEILRRETSVNGEQYHSLQNIKKTDWCSCITTHTQ